MAHIGGKESAIAAGIFLKIDPSFSIRETLGFLWFDKPTIKS